ncbi:tenascin-like [Anneissia japonica]|uniref:tenascin-like n=1 Tax=Anneissia japonica TaxID=1529436 RepID=UPI001425B590|nr:tenascin-like [Anneissia japonica]
MGSNCLTACGGNRFGWSCEKRCTWIEDLKDQCRFQICLPDPFGCQCAAGFTGISCNSECPAGTYGAGCKQVCHCKSASCNRYTGACSECMNSWNGESCQIPDVCPDGYYGDQCIQKCHCKDDKSCDKDTGHCINGQCAVGYALSDASICEPCVGDSYGDGCNETCNCPLDYCHNEKGCLSDCFDYWLAPSCTIGIVAVGYDKCNSGEPTNFTCSVTGNITGVDVRLQYQNSLSSSLSPVTLLPVTVETTDGILLARFIADADITQNYRCRIQDGEYWTTRALHFDVYDLPGYNGKASVLNSTNSSVTLKWRPWSIDKGDTGDGPVIDYVVFYKRSRDQEWNSVPSTSGMTSVKVTGLSANTEYEFSVAAVRPCTGGRGEMGMVLNSTTLCSPPGTPFTTLTSGDMLRQLNVNWSVPHVDTDCPITSFTIYYSELGFEDDETHIVVNDTVREYTILCLNAFTAYNVELTSRNKDFESLRSSNMAYTTEEKAVPPIVSMCSDSPITLQIGTNSMGIFGNVTHFNIRYREENVKDETWQLVKLASKNGSATWIGNDLTAGKVYVFEVRAVNRLGEGRWSNTFSAISRRGTIPNLVVIICISLALLILLICNAFFLICCWIMRPVSSKELEQSRDHFSMKKKSTLEQKKVEKEAVKNDDTESYYKEIDTDDFEYEIPKEAVNTTRILKSANDDRHYSEPISNDYSETMFSAYEEEIVENEVFKKGDTESIYEEMDNKDYETSINT